MGDLVLSICGVIRSMRALSGPTLGILRNDCAFPKSTENDCRNGDNSHNYYCSNPNWYRNCLREEIQARWVSRIWRPKVRQHSENQRRENNKNLWA